MTADEHIQRLRDNIFKNNQTPNNFDFLVQARKETFESLNFFKENANLPKEFETILDDFLGCVNENIRLIVKQDMVELVNKHIQFFNFECKDKLDNLSAIELKFFIKGSHSFYLFEKNIIQNKYGRFYEEDQAVKEFENMIADVLTSVEAKI